MDISDPHLRQMGSSTDLQFSFFSHTFDSSTIAQSVCGILQSFNCHVPTLYDRTKHCAERDLGNQITSQERELSDGGEHQILLGIFMWHADHLRLTTPTRPYWEVRPNHITTLHSLHIILF